MPANFCPSEVRAVPARQRGGGRSEEVAAVKGSGHPFPDLELDSLDLRVVQHRGEHPVVGTHEPVSVCAEGQGGARAADSGIYHDQVDCARGKAVPGASQDVCGGSYISGSDLVRYINQRGSRSTTEEDALHFGDVGVGGAEVGEEGDYPRSSPPQDGQRHAPASSFALQLLGDIPEALSGGTLRLGNQDGLPFVRQNRQLRL